MLQQITLNIVPWVFNTLVTAASIFLMDIFLQYTFLVESIFHAIHLESGKMKEWCSTFPVNYSNVYIVTRKNCIYIEEWLRYTHVLIINIDLMSPHLLTIKILRMKRMWFIISIRRPKWLQGIISDIDNNSHSGLSPQSKFMIFINHCSISCW
jgi:hypothetical protein